MSSLLPGGGRCTHILEHSEKTCPCRQYQDPDNTVPGEPILCRECAHGKSLHVGPGIGEVYNSRVTAMVRELKGEPRQSALGEAVKHWSAGSKGSAATSSGSGTRGSTSTAKAEKKKALLFTTIDMLVDRYLPVTTQKPSNSLPKTLPTTSSIRQVGIGGIYVWPCGWLPGTFELVDERVPDAFVIGQLVNAQLASTNKGQGFKFNPTWGPAHMLQMLRDSLPRVFEEFAVDSPWIETIGVDAHADTELTSYTLPFVLLFARYGKFKAIDNEPYPNGDTFNRFKGRKGAPAADSFFWIAPRHAIAVETLLDWGLPMELTTKWGTMLEEGTATLQKARDEVKAAEEKKTKRTRQILEAADKDTTTDDEIEGGLFYTSPRRKKSKTPKIEGPATAGASPSAETESGFATTTGPSTDTDGTTAPAVGVPATSTTGTSTRTAGTVGVPATSTTGTSTRTAGTAGPSMEAGLSTARVDIDLTIEEDLPWGFGEFQDDGLLGDLFIPEDDSTNERADLPHHYQVVTDMWKEDIQWSF
ncbi:hypothetical protein LXA43DRAFT_1061474 [Ganoderma leucocontextum]|nr:hypothetical protein LXA43DRAFT_1061474 [Ganoderma leucocontextum]